MKAFEYVNMFNHGITEVQDALHTNDNPPAEFNVNLVTAFSVILKDDAATYEESIEKVNLDIACSQIVPNLDQEVKVLIASMEGGKNRFRAPTWTSTCTTTWTRTWTEKSEIFQEGVPISRS